MVDHFTSNVAKTSLLQHIGLLIKSKLQNMIFFDFTSVKTQMLALIFVT